MPENLLICTVGGSHAPIVSAILEVKPVHVCFVCTGRDPGTGTAGSEVQVTGKGNIIKANSGDEKPTLPNIPTQTGLATEQFECRLTTADDLDEVYRVCRVALEELKLRWPQARIVADYTGGTKTMSAGLVAAALEMEGVVLQLVTGNRTDLVRVRDGMQSVGEANADALRLERAMAPYLGGWRHYAYVEAAQGLRILPSPRGPLLASLNRARDLSAAFAAWDRFDHAAALQTLKDYAPTLPEAWREYHAVLRRLVDPEKREAAQLLDLYRNAGRRAAQGRYDDAVARIYRMIEWTAQWLLKSHRGVETGDIPDGFTPAGVDLAVNREGKRQAGLFAAWSLVEARTQGAASSFFAAEKNRLLDHLKTRNHSILAHGFTPIAAREWDNIHAWIESAFLPMLLEEARAVGIKAVPPQLPEAYVP